MNYNISLISGKIKESYTERQSLEKLLQCIDVCCEQSGILTLDVVGVELGPQNLQLISEKGFHVILLGEEDEEDYFVRTLNTEASSVETIEVLGNHWDAHSVTTNRSLVYSVFQEFYETGDVSIKVLS